VQSAYRILASTSPKKLSPNKADLWDSGKIETDRSTQVEYQGLKPASRQKCFWKVMTWDGNKTASAWSRTAWWEMGLLASSDWRGEWIGNRAAGRGLRPARYLRKDFIVKQGLNQARIYATALGLYTLFINGRRVGIDHFTPGWTDYKKRIPYQTYDITGYLNPGKNTVGAILGDGWFCGHIGLADKNQYGDRPYLLLQIENAYQDQTREIVATDDTWRITSGPIRGSDMLMGEKYDARLEMPGWDRPGFKASGWKTPKIRPRGDIPLTPGLGTRVRTQMELVPKSVTEPKPGHFIFDLGQNMPGWARLSVKGPRGCCIRLRFGEVLNPDGTLYTKNLRKAKCRDTYILKGGPRETYEPFFTYRGFRYVEVVGYPGIPRKTAIKGIVAYSDASLTGSFECSSPMLNRLQQNITWSQRSNFFEVPTDCPQRDERLGWTGDAQIFIRTACFNMDLAGFFSKWLTDLSDAQHENGAFPHVAPDVLGEAGVAGWGDAGIICPWNLYLCYGDSRVLKTHYDAMAAWIDYMRQNSNDLIRPDAGFGDWVSLEAETPKDLIATAFFGHSTRLMARIAEVLNRKKEMRRYNALFERIRKAFGREFITQSGRIVGDTQTGYVLALAFDLVPDRILESCIDRLVKAIAKRDGHLSTGFLGTGYLLPVLTKAGRTDLAYQLLLNTSFPSWGYQIERGATTIWERWDSLTEEKGLQDPEMNSFNHYAFGAVGEWLYHTLAGIDLDPLEPGYKKIILHPCPGGGLSSAKAAYNSIHGRILSEWTLTRGRFKLKVEIPPNTRAAITLPAPAPDRVTESGKPLKQAEGIRAIRVENDQVVIEAGSGRYRFVCS